MPLGVYYSLHQIFQLVSHCRIRKIKILANSLKLLSHIFRDHQDLAFEINHRFSTTSVTMLLMIYLYSWCRIVALGNENMSRFPIVVASSHGGNVLSQLLAALFFYGLVSTGQGQVSIIICRDVQHKFNFSQLMSHCRLGKYFHQHSI